MYKNIMISHGIDERLTFERKVGSGRVTGIQAFALRLCTLVMGSHGGFLRKK